MLSTLRSAIPLALLHASLIASSPLTVHDAANFEGPGVAVPEAFTVYSGTQIPEGLDDKISSFRLAAGFMATLAVSPNGLGPGKTYIAEGSDLLVPSLPTGLDNALSFIRVVPWQTAKKKGTGGNLSDQPSLDASWYYRWGYNLEEGQAEGELEYVPMSWGANGSRDDAIVDYLAMDQVTNLLGFNESDHCEGQSGQYNNLCDVPTAVGFYRNLQKAGLRLGSPATREGGAQNTNGWLNQFIVQCEAEDIRIDFVALHWYDWESSPANNPVVPASEIFRRFKRYLSNAYHRHRRPVWITEFNANINRATNIQNEFMQLALPYLESVGYVERYAWFQPSTGTGDFFADGELTSTGQIYKDQVSTPAYTSGALPSIWESGDIGSPALSGTTIHANGTFTVCGSGSGIGGSADSFHYLYAPVAGDASLIVYVDSILQRGNAKAGLMIRETLEAGSKHASMLLTENGEARFEHRSATDGSSEAATQGGLSGHYWLKLERAGDTITGSYSTDAENWTVASQQSVTLEETVYIGLASTSQNNTNFCDTIFKSLSLSNDSDGDQLEDVWELEYFENLTASEGTDGNFDGDPNTDFEEFIAGTNPTDSRSYFASQPVQSENGSLEIAIQGVAGRTYVLEVSPTMAPASWEAVQTIVAGADGPISFDYNIGETSQILFGRVRVEN